MLVVVLPQQAGHQSQINHLLKIKAQQKREREQWW